MVTSLNYWGNLTIIITSLEPPLTLSVYLYSISIEEWLSYNNWQWIYLQSGVSSYNSLSEGFFNAWFDMGGNPDAEGGSFGMGGAQITAYDNVVSASEADINYQDWQEILTNADLQITDLWIIADNNVPESANFIHIFTKIMKIHRII